MRPPKNLDKYVSPFEAAQMLREIAKGIEVLSDDMLVYVYVDQRMWKREWGKVGAGKVSPHRKPSDGR